MSSSEPIEVHVCAGPTHTYCTVPDDRPDRFCFHCRKRTQHQWRLIGDPPGRETYYENVAVIDCTVCGNDAVSFPGQELDGPRWPGNQVCAAISRAMSSDQQGAHA